VSASEQLKRKLEDLNVDGAGQLQSIFGEHISPPCPSGRYRRIFDPVTTFWTFLSQVLQDGSCRNATREVQARRKGSRISSANTAYCKARKRLPLEWIEKQGSQVAQRLRNASAWDWNGRRVLLVDATSCRLPDTADNQAEYPQPGGQKPGCGMPVMQLVGVFDLGSAALLGWDRSPWKVNECGLFKTAVLPHVAEGDVLVGDRAYDSYANLAQLQLRGGDGVFRMHGRRKCPLKANQEEVVEILPRPRNRPDSCTDSQWEALPETLKVRHVRVKLSRPGFRTHEVTLLTTLMEAPAEEIARLYLRRWQIEVCFRDIKTTLGMELLRGKSPAIAEREVAMHLLAYNLLRTLMLEAAHAEDQPLYRMSFAGARDAACRFAPTIAHAPTKRKREAAIAELLRCIAFDPIPIRPNRKEPRAVKRRPKAYQLLTRPRHHMTESPSRRLK